MICIINENFLLILTKISLTLNVLTMKKFTAILAASVMAVLFSGIANAQISVGAGYGLASHTSKVTADGTSVTDPNTNMNGFYVNGSYDWQFMDQNWGALSLQPGLTYSFFTKSLDEISEMSESSASLKEHYLDIPVNVKYSYNLIPGTLKLSAYAGPVFSVGLASNTVVSTSEDGNDMTIRTNMYNGNTRVYGTVNGEKVDQSQEGESTGYGRFDLKLGLGITATVFEKFDVKIGYNIGLLNRMAKANTDDSSRMISRTNVFTIGVGYNF